MSAPGIFRPPTPTNEPVKTYAPGSREREELLRLLRDAGYASAEARAALEPVLRTLSRRERRMRWYFFEPS